MVRVLVGVCMRGDLLWRLKHEQGVRSPRQPDHRVASTHRAEHPCDLFDIYMISHVVHADAPEKLRHGKAFQFEVETTCETPQEPRRSAAASQRATAPLRPPGAGPTHRYNQAERLQAALAATAALLFWAATMSIAVMISAVAV